MWLGLAALAAMPEGFEGSPYAADLMARLPARKDVIVGLLLADPNGPPPLSLLPPPKTKAPSGGKATGATGKAGTAELQALEQRHVRLEQLVLLIAQQVGVPPEAIAQLTTAAALPPT